MMGLRHCSRASPTGAATALPRRPCHAHGSYSGAAPSAESLQFWGQVCLLKLGISLCVVVLLCPHAERCPWLSMLSVSAEIRYETLDGIYSGMTSLPILSIPLPWLLICVASIRVCGFCASKSDWSTRAYSHR